MGQMLISTKNIIINFHIIKAQIHKLGIKICDNLIVGVILKCTEECQLLHIANVLL